VRQPAQSKRMFCIRREGKQSFIAMLEIASHEAESFPAHARNDNFTWLTSVRVASRHTPA
jgi:hypothetical protein